MVNFICLKWGTKYNSDWVNRLYYMIEENFSDDFTFSCYTEDPSNIEKNIIIKDLPNYDLEKWWWKLTFFETPVNDTTIFIDLDVVIQNDITHWQNFVQENKLCTIKAYWKSHIPLNEDHYLNSSVMIWKGDLTSIWKDFIQNKDKYVSEYHGIDSTLFYHHFDKLIWIPRGEIYSRLYGIDENRYQERQFKYKTTPEEVKSRFFFDADYNMCIFNGYKRTKLLGPKGEKKFGIHYLDDDSFVLFKKLGYI